MKGYIVYANHETVGDETFVQLFGRLENGQSFFALNKFEPYFFVRSADESKASQFAETARLEKTNLTNFKKEKVTKLTFRNKTDMDEAYKKLHKKLETYEADLKPQYKFIIDKDLFGSINIEGSYEPLEKTDRFYREPKISSAHFTPKLKIASIDTESDKKGKLFCIGIFSDGVKKNFMITKHKLEHVISCSSEEECLEKFKAELLKIDPDIITGWNVIDFDFPFLKELFRKHRIVFDIGRTDAEPRLRIESNFFRASSVSLPGRQVLDALNLVKDPFLKDSPFMRNAKFESYTLEDVSQEVLKKGKLLVGKERHEEIEKLYKENTQSSHQKLADYNLMDCQLPYEILEKTKMIELAIERSQLTGLPLDRLTASIAAFDSLYIRAARRRALVSPTNDYKEKEKSIAGGYVSSLNPGIYHNVLILDFKSLYPSIIRTFNIDPASLLEEEKKGCVKAPNGACFENTDGILPEIISRLHAAREKAKKEKRALSSHAIKIIMNSFFGVLASPNCRYFNLAMANAITHFGQFLIKLTAKEIESRGFKVLYSDTDSVFVETNLGKTKANELGEKLANDINNFYKNYVKEGYSRESHLELEFEKQYLSLMIPKIRGSKKAAKKRYAGLTETDGKEKLEIVGLEAIRGDWTEAAQEFQVELLKKLFHDEPIEKFIRDYIKKIRDGEMDAKLIYRKSIRKSLEEYTKTTPPHVKAARKLPHLESNVIEYYITTDGPEPIQKHTHKIDYEHYIEKQIRPIADQILSVFDKKFEEVSEKAKQTKLF